MFGNALGRRRRPPIRAVHLLVVIGDEMRFLNDFTRRRHLKLARLIATLHDACFEAAFSRIGQKRYLELVAPRIRCARIRIDDGIINPLIDVIR